MKSKIIKISIIFILIISLCLNINLTLAVDDEISGDDVSQTPVENTPEPTPEKTPEQTETPEPTNTPEPTETPEQTNTPEPTPEQTPEETPEPTPSEKPRNTATPKPTTEPTPEPTSTPEPTEEPDENNTNNTSTTYGDITINTVVKKSIIDKEDFSGKGVSLIKIKGIDKNGKSVDLSLDPKFNVNTYSYKCNVGLDYEKIEINIELVDEEWKSEIVGNNTIEKGENLITIITSNEDKTENVTYQINVVKEDKVVEENLQTEDNSKSSKTATKDIILIVCLAVIIISIGTIAVTKYLSYRKKTKNIRRDTDE